MSADVCRACGAPGAQILLERDSVPVFLNQTYTTRDEAARAATGRIELRGCAHCGFAFNAAFEAARVEYGVDYDNDVSFSSAYVEHLSARLGARSNAWVTAMGGSSKWAAGRDIFCARFVSSMLCRS